MSEEKGAAPLPELVKPKEDTHDEETNLGRSGGQPVPGNQYRGGDSLGNTTGRNQPESVDTRAAERVNETSKTDSGETVSGDNSGTGGNVGAGIHEPVTRLEMPVEPETGNQEQAMPVQEKEKPVQASKVSSLVDYKRVAKKKACTGLPDLTDDRHWRFKDGQPPMPKGFMPVPHLKSEILRTVVENGQAKYVYEVVTAWQIQWNTKCGECKKRFRPVCGFISAQAFRQMLKKGQNEQKNAIREHITGRFNEGRVNRRCTTCATSGRGALRSMA